MKTCSLTLAILILGIFELSAQSVGINTTSTPPDPSALLDLASDDKGMLVPRMTAVQRNAIADPATGLMIYQLDEPDGFYYYNGDRWTRVGDSFGEIGIPAQVGAQDTTGPLPEYVMGQDEAAADTSGILYDSGGPDAPYGNNEDTTLMLYRPPGSIGLRLTLLSFDVEGTYDSLIIDASSWLSTESFALTGEYDPQTLPLIGGAAAYITFQFKSNYINTPEGFAIRWDWVFPLQDTTEHEAGAGWFFDPSTVSMRGGIGTGNAWDHDSLGFASIAWGQRAMATGPNAIAFGLAAGARGYGAVGLSSSVAYGDFAFAAGVLSRALGYSAVAIGEGCTAATRAVALGGNCNALDDYSFATGYYATAQGAGSTALGYHSLATGNFSFAGGYYSEAHGNTATSIGIRTKAKGGGTLALGNGTQANGFASLVIGVYNDTLVSPQISIGSTTPLFIIGNGSLETRSNAMVVRKDGRVGIGNNTPAQLLHVGHTTGDAIRIGSFETLSDAGGGVMSVNADFIPSTDNTNDLGSASARWDDIWATNGVIQTSDARDKENIIEIENGLEKVMQLRPVTYQWKEGPDRSFQLGLIAQEVQEIIPGVVRSTNFVRDEDGNVTEVPTERLGMNYAALTPIVIKAMQELQVENSALQSSLQAQAEEVAALRRENTLLRETLEARIASLEHRLAD